MVGQQYLMEIKEFLSMLYFFELMLWVIIYGIYSIINKNHKLYFFDLFSYRKGIQSYFKLDY